MERQFHNLGYLQVSQNELTHGLFYFKIENDICDNSDSVELIKRFVQIS